MTDSAAAANQDKDSFNAMISAKEQQKRDSIMNELYNEISSSDDEDEDNSTANSDAKTATSLPAAAGSSGNNASSSPQKPASSVEKQDGADGAAGGGELANPFKRQVSAQASEALKELYGDDYEEPIGFEEAKTSE